MAPKKTNAKTINWKSELLAGGDVVRELFRDVLQEVLEGEMTETLQAKPGERTLRFGHGSDAIEDVAALWIKEHLKEFFAGLRMIRQCAVGESERAMGAGVADEVEHSGAVQRPESKVSNQ